MSVLVLCLLIAALLLIRVPVAFSFFGPCLLYMMTTDQSVGLALRLVANSTASFPLLAVPLFILLGSIANHAGIADRLFDFALALLGRVRGSLGYVSVGVSLGFSWMSGSAVADAAALGKVEIPAMLRAGYPRPFALGVVGSSSLIAPVMPPSIPAVIYAGLAGVSTGALFAASVVPALLMAVGLCLVVYLWVRRMPNIQRTEFRREQVWVTGRRVIAPLGAPVIILGGILGGYVTPTEAAAVGALYMLLLGFAYRTLKLRDLPRVLVEAALTTGSIMLIVASANLLGYVFARERIPQDISEWVLGLTTDPTVFLLLVFALSMVLGTALDAIAVLTLTVPILLPIALAVRRRPHRAGRADDPVADDRPADATGRDRHLRAAGDHQGPDGRGLLGLAAVPRASDRALLRDHLLARRHLVPSREVGAVSATAARRSWLVGLIGHGVGPSLTPEMHEREAARQGLRYVYKVIDLPGGDVAEERLTQLLAGARDLGFDGLNVTHPVKQAMVPLVDTLAPAVSAIGALNTVLFRDGQTVGHNTDVTGFRRSFTDAMPGVDRRTVALLGAGGAGTAVAHALADLEVGELLVVDPDAARARALAGTLDGRATRIELVASTPDEMAAAIGRSAGLVNATPIGMAAHPGTSVPVELLRRDLWVADIVYRPLNTALLDLARDAGCTVLNGAGMAVHQAADSFELITGLPADRAAMLRDFDELVAAEAALDPTRDTTGERNR